MNYVNLFADTIREAKDNRLLVACENSKKFHVTWLLRLGANIEATDEYGRSPLMIACCKNNKEIVELLLKNGANIEAKGNHNHTPLFYACYNNNKEIIELLLKNGANIEAADTHGLTPLIYACCRNNNKEGVTLLLEKGANIEATDNCGRTPLIYACYKNNKEIVELLLEKGANIEATDKYGQTPFDIACNWERIELAEILIKYGADIVNVHKSPNVNNIFENEYKRYSQLNNQIKKLKQKMDNIKKDYVEPASETMRTIKQLMSDPLTPAFAKQSALVYLLKYHTFFPDTVTKKILLSYYKEIAFNYRFFSDSQFKSVREFAIKEHAKDTFGRSVLAVALSDSRNRQKDKSISKVIEITGFGNTLKAYYLPENNEKNHVSNNFINVLSSAKKSKNKQKFKSLIHAAESFNDLQYLEHGPKTDKKPLPYEIAARIMSFMKL